MPKKFEEKSKQELLEEKIFALHPPDKQITLVSNDQEAFDLSVKQAIVSHFLIGQFLKDSNFQSILLPQLDGESMKQVFSQKINHALMIHIVFVMFFRFGNI